MGGPRYKTGDRIALLCALGAAHRADIRLGNTNLQKSIFKAELDLKEKRLTGPDLRFIRWNYGPYSKTVARIHSDMEELGLAGDGSLSQRALELEDFVQSELRRDMRWEAVIDAIEEAAQTIGSMTALAAQRWSHSLVLKAEKLDEPTSVHDMPLRTIILQPSRWAAPLSVPEDVVEAVDYAWSLTEIDVQEMMGPGRRVTLDELFRAP